MKKYLIILSIPLILYFKDDLIFWSNKFFKSFTIDTRSDLDIYVDDFFNNRELITIERHKVIKEKYPNVRMVDFIAYQMHFVGEEEKRFFHLMKISI